MHRLPGRRFRETPVQDEPFSSFPDLPFFSSRSIFAFSSGVRPYTSSGVGTGIAGHSRTLILGFFFFIRMLNPSEIPVFIINDENQGDNGISAGENILFRAGSPDGEKPAKRNVRRAGIDRLGVRRHIFFVASLLF